MGSVDFFRKLEPSEHPSRAPALTLITCSVLPVLWLVFRFLPKGARDLSPSVYEGSFGSELSEGFYLGSRVQKSLLEIYSAAIRPGLPSD